MLRGIFLSVLTLTAGCQVASPLVGRHPVDPEQAEALAGLRAARTLEGCYGGVLRDRIAESRMERIAGELAERVLDRPITCRCRLLLCNKINAFSLPGGLIYVTKGLYERLSTDDRLAAVLAHELAHIVAKDSFKSANVTASIENEPHVRGGN